MITRAETRFDDRIYSSEWRTWRDPEIPEYFNPVSVLLGRHAGGPADDKPALLVDGAPMSYRELRALVARTARGLADLGLRPGERILLFGTDSIEYLAVWLGAVQAGIVPAVVSDLYKTKDLLYFIRDTDSRALFIDSEQLPKLAEIAPELPPGLSTILVRPPVAIESGAVGGRTVVDAAAVTAAAGEAPCPLRHCNDVCYMFYSGGTTGTAKGITHLCHDFFLVPSRQGAFWEYSADDVVFATSKKYFTHGLWPGVLIPLAFGATAVLQRRPPSPDAVIEAVTSTRATKLITVPTVIKNLLEHCRANDLHPDFGSVGLVVSASEKIPPEVFDRFEAAFGLEILDSIGSSEITYEWIANRQKDSKRGSLGKPVFGYEIRLVGPDGEDVTEPNVPGEAWVKSRTSCFFYWRKFDKSRETFVGPWTRTGDNLTFDEDGFFWFSGRDNDVFKVSGLWVSPIEIEAAITEHPAILEAAVVAFEDGDGLTKPRAFAVLRQGAEASDALIDELKANVRRLGGYKVPAEFRFVDQLPRTTLMKIDRRALRALQAAG
ncbi:benzoate-CoA ligase family protein [Propylenella binzhouense]|uniref:Benzoate-CoA ligase family protein n=1 Tax=Propylenella binzhouense TaxID=2555902 RepID=A0A964T2J9_9HYPH|nr:benzoate-CoA ligase family protein [Propylenella binzhouense]MYZ47124.1 benzoate-CoA ligase family protein [Propylenella binzhouense]